MSTETTAAALPAQGADVFISYARENRAVAAQLAEALAQGGLRVWWDRDLVAGSRFSERIEAELGGARCVLTLWSADAIRSGFVRDEATRAMEAGKLIPLRIEAVALPLGFGQLHTLDLLDWDGDAEDPRLADVLTAIAAPRGAPSAEPVAGPAFSPRPKRPRWRLVALAAVVAGVVTGGGLWWQSQADAAEADQRFREGLERQFAREPNLESARNLYLSALEQQPRHARARYYLGHVYVQLGQPALARTAFERALQQIDQLDEAQQADARRQVAALSPVIEPAAVGPALAAAPAGAAPPPAPPQPAPAVVAAPPAVGAVRPGRPIVVADEAVRLPPRLPLPAASQGRLADQVAALFDGSRDARIRATTSLILDPEALSDAVPLAVDRALPLAELAQATDAQLSGVINTLVLLQNALPATLLAHAADIRRLIDAARPQGPATQRQADQLAALLAQAEGQQPKAFIQIASEVQRPLALALAQRLRERGYSVPGIERVGNGRSPQHSEIRVHSKSDRGLARWLVKVMDEFTTDTPAVSTLRNTRPSTDTFEIWLGAELCETTVVARCQPGS